MSDLVKVRSLTVFEGSEEKRWIAEGDEWEVTPARAAELEANRLVQRFDADAATTVEIPPVAPAAPVEVPADPAATVEVPGVTTPPARPRRAPAA